MKMLRASLFLIALTVFLAASVSAQQSAFLANYKGTPFTDSHHPTVEKIPGRVLCAYYDRGGEGIAYHDTTQKITAAAALTRRMAPTSMISA